MSPSLDELFLTLPLAIKGEGVAWITLSRDSSGVFWTAGYEVFSAKNPLFSQQHTFASETVRGALSEMLVHLNGRAEKERFMTDLLTRPTGGWE